MFLPAITDGVVAGMNKLDIAGNKLSLSRVPTSSAAMLLKPSAASPATGAAAVAGTGSLSHTHTHTHTHTQNHLLLLKKCFFNSQYISTHTCIHK